MRKDILLSDNCVSKTTSDYREILNNIDELIDDTGYEDKEIAEKLGISLDSFYKKKRQKTFLPKELEQIVQWADEGNDMEAEYTMKVYEECKDEVSLPLDTLRIYLGL